MTPTKDTLRKGQPVTITFQGETVTAKYIEWSDKYNLAIVDYNGRRLHRNLKDDLSARSNGSTPPPMAESFEPAAPKFSVAQRFSFLEKFTRMVASATAFSLVVAGEGGLGKSHTVEEQLKKAGLKEIDPEAVNDDAKFPDVESVGADDEAEEHTEKEAADGDYRIIKGFSTPKAMYRALFENHDKIVIFDDCDAVLDNDTAVNILKGALDSKATRKISWLTELKRTDDDLPQNFIFSGGVIFISNHRLEDIPQPLLSRALTVDVSMTSSEKIERMRFIAAKVDNGLTAKQKDEVIDFIDGLKDSVGDLNMRTFLKVGEILLDDPSDWKAAAEYMITAL